MERCHQTVSVDGVISSNGSLLLSCTCNVRPFPDDTTNVHQHSLTRSKNDLKEREGVSENGMASAWCHHTDRTVHFKSTRNAQPYNSCVPATRWSVNGPMDSIALVRITPHLTTHWTTEGAWGLYVCSECQWTLRMCVAVRMRLVLCTYYTFDGGRRAPCADTATHTLSLEG